MDTPRSPERPDTPPEPPLRTRKRRRARRPRRSRGTPQAQLPAHAVDSLVSALLEGGVLSPAESYSDSTASGQQSPAAKKQNTHPKRSRRGRQRGSRNANASSPETRQEAATRTFTPRQERTYSGRRLQPAASTSRGEGSSSMAQPNELGSWAANQTQHDRAMLPLTWTTRSPGSPRTSEGPRSPVRSLAYPINRAYSRGRPLPLQSAAEVREEIRREAIRAISRGLTDMIEKSDFVTKSLRKLDSQ